MAILKRVIIALLTIVVYEAGFSFRRKHLNDKTFCFCPSQDDDVLSLVIATIWTSLYHSIITIFSILLFFLHKDFIFSPITTTSRLICNYFHDMHVIASHLYTKGWDFWPYLLSIIEKRPPTFSETTELDSLSKGHDLFPIKMPPGLTKSSFFNLLSAAFYHYWLAISILIAIDSMIISFKCCKCRLYATERRSGRVIGGYSQIVGSLAEWGNKTVFGIFMLLSVSEFGALLCAFLFFFTSPIVKAAVGFITYSPFVLLCEGPLQNPSFESLYIAFQISFSFLNVGPSLFLACSRFLSLSLLFQLSNVVHVSNHGASTAFLIRLLATAYLIRTLRFFVASLMIASCDQQVVRREWVRLSQTRSNHFFPIFNWRNIFQHNAVSSTSSPTICYIQLLVHNMTNYSEFTLVQYSTRIRDRTPFIPADVTERAQNISNLNTSNQILQHLSSMQFTLIQLNSLATWVATEMANRIRGERMNSRSPYSRTFSHCVVCLEERACVELKPCCHIVLCVGCFQRMFFPHLCSSHQESSELELHECDPEELECCECDSEDLDLCDRAEIELSRSRFEEFKQCPVCRSHVLDEVIHTNSSIHSHHPLNYTVEQNLILLAHIRDKPHVLSNLSDKAKEEIKSMMKRTGFAHEIH